MASESMKYRGGIMTFKELRNYPYVLNAIERYEDELAELYDDSAGSMSPDMSGMPHGNGGTSSKVVAGYERNEKRITELTEKLNNYRERLHRYEHFFNAIDDEHILQIFELRFKKQLSWMQISTKLGCKKSPEALRQICYRYLKETEK